MFWISLLFLFVPFRYRWFLDQSREDLTFSGTARCNLEYGLQLLGMGCKRLANGRTLPGGSGHGIGGCVILFFLEMVIICGRLIIRNGRSFHVVQTLPSHAIAVHAPCSWLRPH